MSDLKRILSQTPDEVWSKGDVDAIARFYHPDFKHQEPDGEAMTFAQLHADLMALKAAIPDFHEVVHDLICEGDQVVARLTLAGTQAADYREFPSRGKRFEIDSIDIYRFVDDKLIEQLGVTDRSSMAEQLGW